MKFHTEPQRREAKCIQCVSKVHIDIFPPLLAEGGGEGEGKNLKRSCDSLRINADFSLQRVVI